MGIQSIGVFQGGGVGEVVGRVRGKVSLWKRFGAWGFEMGGQNLYSELGILDMVFQKDFVRGLAALVFLG